VQLVEQIRVVCVGLTLRVEQSPSISIEPSTVMFWVIAKVRKLASSVLSVHGIFRISRRRPRARFRLIGQPDKNPTGTVPQPNRHGTHPPPVVTGMGAAPRRP
jgi:hypothetical protein